MKTSSVVLTDDCVSLANDIKKIKNSLIIGSKLNHIEYILNNTTKIIIA